jgi:hypothetical protein
VAIAIAPIVGKAPVIEMKGPVPQAVLDAAAGSIGVRYDVDFTEYTGGGHPVRVLSRVKITVTKKPKEWVVDVGADNPEIISATRGTSAKEEAAQLMLARTQAMWAKACAELKAKIR